MNAQRATRLARITAVLAGAMDLLTGLGLVFAPAATLGLMRVASIGPEALVFLRFVGAFVGAVGFVYLMAFFRRDPLHLRAMLGMTIVFRFAAGSYSATAVARGWLDPGWVSVPVTDFFLAGWQAWLLSKGVGREG